MTRLLSCEPAEPSEAADRAAIKRLRGCNVLVAGSAVELSRSASVFHPVHIRRIIQT